MPNQWPRRSCCRKSSACVSLGELHQVNRKIQTGVKDKSRDFSDICPGCPYLVMFNRLSVFFLIFWHMFRDFCWFFESSHKSQTKKTGIYLFNFSIISPDWIIETFWKSGREIPVSIISWLFVLSLYSLGYLKNSCINAEILP